MTYTKSYTAWADYPTTTTPVTAAKLQNIDDGVYTVSANTRELAYTEFTSNFTVSATAEAISNTIVTAAAVTFDGSTKAQIQFFASTALIGASGDLTITLWDTGVDQGYCWYSNSAGLYAPIGTLVRETTPSAGSHTYSFRAFRNTADATIFANTGSAGVSVPGFIRVVAVNS